MYVGWSPEACAVKMIHATTPIYSCICIYVLIILIYTLQVPVVKGQGLFQTLLLKGVSVSQHIYTEVQCIKKDNSYKM